MAPAYVPVQEAAAQAGLVRPVAGRVIAGVCAGFAQRYGWDVTLVRILLVVLVVFGCGTPLLAYLIAWIAMPEGMYPVVAQSVVPPVAQQGQTQA